MQKKTKKIDEKLKEIKSNLKNMKIYDVENLHKILFSNTEQIRFKKLKQIDEIINYMSHLKAISKIDTSAKETYKFIEDNIRWALKN